MHECVCVWEHMFERMRSDNRTNQSSCEEHISPHVSLLLLLRAAEWEPEENVLSLELPVVCTGSSPFQGWNFFAVVGWSCTHQRFLFSARLFCCILLGFSRFWIEFLQAPLMTNEGFVHECVCVSVCGQLEGEAQLCLSVYVCVLYLKSFPLCPSFSTFTIISLDIRKKK